MAGQAEQRGRASLSLGRLLPLLVLAGGLVAFFAFGLDSYASLAILRQHRAWALDQVAGHPLRAALVYMAVYILVTAFSLPVATLISLVGGFLFGNLSGTALTVAGATVGASILFLAARTALGDYLRGLAGPRLARLEQGFRAHAFSYMLFLRLVPVFPFWLVNLAPAFLGVSLPTFVASTFVGVIPGAFVYVNLGRGLGRVLDTEGGAAIDDLLSADIILALSLLSLLALVPVVYRRWKARRSEAAT